MPAALTMKDNATKMEKADQIIKNTRQSLKVNIKCEMSLSKVAFCLPLPYYYDFTLTTPVTTTSGEFVIHCFFWEDSFGGEWRGVFFTHKQLAANS